MCAGFVLHMTTYVLVSTNVSEVPIMHQRVRSSDERHFNYASFNVNEAWGEGDEMS